ncbi:MAG: outer membrane protein assembly factor BamA [Lentisphaeria bacterium]|nr:outer membrane protein assembly factor BamA [Lentisphaeria bacterium]
MRIKFFLTFLILQVALTLAAQTVAKRTFNQMSDFKYDESILELTVQTRKGAPFSEQIMNEDVRRLSARNVFSDVSASTKHLPDGTVEVTFNLVAKPVVAGVVIENAKLIPPEKIRGLVGFTTQAPLNDELVSVTADRIRALYKEEGRGGTKVKTVLEDQKDGTILVKFVIEEEMRIRINDVTFEGNSVYTLDDLKAVMESRYFFLSVDWLSWLPFNKGKVGIYDKHALERDKVRLRELYLRKGYLDFKVVKIEATPVEGDPEMVDLHITVEEGEPYFVGDIKVTGSVVRTPEELKKLIRLVPDNVYNVQIEDQDMDRIEALYSPEGYADFRINVERKPNFLTHTVDLEYQISEGPQYEVGKVTIRGNRYTKPHVLLREIPVEPGDKVDKRKLEIARMRLLGLNYFEPQGGVTDSGVDVTMSNSAEPGKKDITIDVNEKQFITANIGGGWSDGDGLAGRIELAHNNMDILDPENWFTGGGQRMRIYAQVGTESKDAAVEFTEPWLFGIPLRWDVSGYWRTNEYDDWDEERLGVSTSLTKRIFDDFTSLQLGYKFEQVKVKHMAHKLGPFFQDQKGRELVGRIFLNVERDTRDSYTDPRRGYIIGSNFELTTQGLGASQDYYKVEFKALGYYPFFHDMFVFSLGGKLGMMGTFGDTDDVPLFDRYFLGGGDTVRGFPYRSIGPADKNDDNYGGEFMYLITAELSHPIYKDYLRGAFFCDFGGASNDVMRFNRPNIGMGYGLRIKLPVCPMPIRLDLAYPVLNNQPGLKSKLRFHFNFGFQF